MSAKMWVYKPWVDKLSLKWPPESTDDFYEMLKAFKAHDPNANGEADEVPLSGSADGWNSNPLTFLMNSFIYTQRGTYGGFLLRDRGKVSFVADTDEWRDGLRYMNRLYNEGLLASETFMKQKNMLKALVESSDAPKVGAVASGWYGVFTVNDGGTGRFAEYQPIAPLRGPKGVRFSRFTPITLRYHVKITNKAERPDIIAQWANWFYQDWQIHRKLSWDFQREGIDWRYLTAAEKELGLVTREGRPALTMPLQSKDYSRRKLDDGWMRAAPRWVLYESAALPFSWMGDPAKQEYRLMIATRDLMEPFKPDEKHMPPNLVFPNDVVEEISDLNEAIASDTGVVEVWSTEFILGVRDIESDADWSSYLNKLVRAGKERYVELWQRAITDAGY